MKPKFIKKKPRRYIIERERIGENGKKWYRSIRRKRWSMREIKRDSKKWPRLLKWLPMCRLNSTFFTGKGGLRKEARYRITRVR